MTFDMMVPLKHVFTDMHTMGILKNRNLNGTKRLALANMKCSKN